MMRNEILSLLILGIIPVLLGAGLIWWKNRKNTKILLVIAIGFLVMAIALVSGIFILSQLKELRFTSFDWIGVLLAYIFFTIGAVDIVFSGAGMRAKKDIFFFVLVAIFATAGTLIFVPKIVIEVVGVGALSGILSLLALYIGASKLNTK